MTSSGPSRPDRPAHRPQLSSANSTSNSDDNTSNTSQLSSSSTPAAASRIPSSGHVSSALAPAWPFNPSETALIRAGYTPTPTPTPAPASNNERQTRQRPRMAEPRARAPRQKGQMNFPTERASDIYMCYVMLYADH
jgi:transcription initiation factor TFIID subunit 13